MTRPSDIKRRKIEPVVYIDNSVKLKESEKWDKYLGIVREQKNNST